MDFDAQPQIKRARGAANFFFTGAIVCSLGALVLYVFTHEGSDAWKTPLLIAFIALALGLMLNPNKLLDS